MVMDVAFETSAYSGKGWNATPNRSSNNALSATQRLNSAEKTPLPVRITSLLALQGNEEKFRIGVYGFNTVKVVGIISSAKVDSDETCVTYDVIDPSHKQIKMAASFTFIRYLGLDSHARNEMIHKGTYIEAVGKLRLFNHRLSLVCFNITEVPSMELVEMHHLEARLAYLYYRNNIPDGSTDELESLNSPLFMCSPPSKNSPGVKTRIQFTTQLGQNNLGGGDAHCRNLYQPAISSFYEKESVSIKNTNPHRLCGQQEKIYEYVRRHGMGEEGVSLKQIYLAIDASKDSVLADIGTLVNRSILYSTIDEEHFASIDD